MKIVFLDAKTIGDDIDLSGYDALGEVVKYGFSTPEEARERTRRGCDCSQQGCDQRAVHR